MHRWCGFTSLLEGQCTRMSCLLAVSFAFGPEWSPPRKRRTGDASDPPHSKIASPKFWPRRVLAHAPCMLGEVPAPGMLKVVKRASTINTELQIVSIPPKPAFPASPAPPRAPRLRLHPRLLPADPALTLAISCISLGPKISPGGEGRRSRGFFLPSLRRGGKSHHLRLSIWTGKTKDRQNPVV